MANLNRNLAPIPDEAWEFIDEEAREALSIHFVGRKVVDFVGPKGMDFSAVNTGRWEDLDNTDGVSYAKREVLPLVELEIPFTMDLKEIEALVRGAEDIDSDNLVAAAKKLAKAENNAIFNGLEAANIDGILEEVEIDPIKVGDDLVAAVASGVKTLITGNEVEGPYTLLLGPEKYASIFESDDNGYPIKKRLEDVIGVEVIPAPILGEQGLLISTEGEDFELIVGQDTAIGYRGQNGSELEFFLTESFTFKINAPEAAVVLK